MSSLILNHFLTPCLALLAALIVPAAPARAEPADEDTALTERLETTLEMGRHQRLVEQMRRPGSRLAPFTTDGCSGGLSVGWQYLADAVEALKDKHGERPPWESCCIAHDRAYHRAGGPGTTAEQSFIARRTADEALRSCVLATAGERAPELTNLYGLSTAEVAFIYEVIADLMYRAVRLGGIPCSGLPWRWGYGWPPCD